MRVCELHHKATWDSERDAHTERDERLGDVGSQHYQRQATAGCDG